MQQEIRLKLKSFDHRALDQAVSSIIQTVGRLGGAISGPIPLPRNIRRYTVNRSSHVDKKSREQFERRSHARLLIFEASPQTVDALMKLDLSSSVGVEIKLTGGQDG